MSFNNEPHEHNPTPELQLSRFVKKQINFPSDIVNTDSVSWRFACYGTLQTRPAL